MVEDVKTVQSTNPEQASNRGNDVKRLLMRYVVLVAFILTTGVAGFFLGISGRTVPLSSGSEPLSMAQCVAESRDVLRLKEPPTTALLRELVDHCYSMIRSDGLLNDFHLRKLTFVQQYQANGLLLWMVIIITIAGVALAGLQLAASYSLAVKNNTALATTDEISLKRDQIVLKSSVTGLFILVISFAFFLVFVFYVYRLEGKAEPTTAPMPQLPMGTLAPPPPKAE